jgi:16S rRNA (cytosine1402-N4)-methyltransferase
LILKRGFPFILTVTVMTYHDPVLANEVARLAVGRSRGVDCTAGGGGHTAIFLDAGLGVLAIDRDPEAVAVLRQRFAPSEVTVLEGRFTDAYVLGEIGRFAPDLVLLDLGVSSHQIDSESRGFSFRPGVPLDMRMTSGAGATAAELLASAPEADLARLFKEYGDEPRARRLAREIARRRTRAPLTTSDDLVNAIRAVLGGRSGPSDFARLFQAVRIAVNDELSQLDEALASIRDALMPGGHLAVIAYHSGEDRMAKHGFREWARECVCPPGQPVCTCRGRALGYVETKRAVRPGPEEIGQNPRARSAKLRVFRKADEAQG